MIDEIYIIPVVLDDDTEVPQQLKGIQYIAASNPKCISHINEALASKLARFELETQKTQRREEFSWSFDYKKETWDGIPGYEVELQFISLQSDRYPSINEIGDFIRGDLLKHLYSFRRSKFEQQPDSFNFGQEKFRRTNTFDAHCGDPHIKGKVLTVQYSIYWYGAGAAHPNTDFQTYSFVIEPLIYISSIEDLFFDKESAFNENPNLRS